MKTISSISELKKIQLSESGTSRGLSSSTCAQDMNSIIKFLEEQARCGDENARKNIQDMIPVCATRCKRGLALWNRPGRAVCFHISLFPDLFVCIMRALCYSRSQDGELVCFMRSCLPFMYNSRRTQGDGGWSKDGKRDMITMFRCCMPTLLSLYSRHGVKDVAFWLRVSIFGFFERLFCQKHEKCNAIYIQLRALFRVCFVEYVYFYTTEVTSVPHARFASVSQNETLYNNAFNMGQQLRVELNSVYGKVANKNGSHGKILSDEEVLQILQETTASCQVMYERNARSSKLVFCENSGSMNENRAKRKTVSSDKQHCKDQHYAACLTELPYTSKFSIFESICRSQGVPSENIVHLWDCTSLVRVYELTAEQTRKQLQTLRSMGIYCLQEAAKCSSLHLCLRCARNGVFSTYRCDLRSDEISCTKCNRADMCVKIGMLGRVAFIRSIPIVMCQHCCKFVVYSGNYQDPTCNHVPWGKHVFSPSFQNELLSNTFMYFARASALGAATPNISYASKNFIAERQNGCVSSNVEVEENGKMCCMCKSTSLQQSYFLLDCYSKRILCVRVCSRHALGAKYDGIKVWTLQQYLMIANSTSSKKTAR